MRRPMSSALTQLCLFSSIQAGQGKPDTSRYVDRDLFSACPMGDMVTYCVESLGSLVIEIFTAIVNRTTCIRGWNIR